MNSAKSSATNVLGHVTFLDGRGDLPMIEVITPWSTAEIYLHGAHVTHFKTNDGHPLLFLSQCSRFEEGQPIRGGIPIIFPWFGPREGLGQHGYARVKAWELKQFSIAPDGSVRVRFRLPDSPDAAKFPACTVEYVVTVSKVLTLELSVTNQSKEVFTYEDCLHTYFTVGNIKDVTVKGLKGASYLDKVDNMARKTETPDVIRIASEVDRTYLDTTSAVEIADAKLGRVIRVEKENSKSTVVWNPWIAKAQQMADYGDEEYHEMVCVESGNVGSNAIKLAPGATSMLKVTLDSSPLR